MSWAEVNDFSCVAACTRELSPLFGLEVIWRMLPAPYSQKTTNKQTNKQTNRIIKEGICLVSDGGGPSGWLQGRSTVSSINHERSYTQLTHPSISPCVACRVFYDAECQCTRCTEVVNAPVNCDVRRMPRWILEPSPEKPRGPGMECGPAWPQGLADDRGSCTSAGVSQPGPGHTANRTAVLRQRVCS